jgi:hypothetical protein
MISTLPIRAKRALVRRRSSCLVRRVRALLPFAMFVAAAVCFAARSRIARRVFPCTCYRSEWRRLAGRAADSRWSRRPTPTQPSFWITSTVCPRRRRKTASGSSLLIRALIQLPSARSFAHWSHCANNRRFPSSLVAVPSFPLVGSTHKFPLVGTLFPMHRNTPNQSMKPTAPLRGNFSVFATTPCRGLSLSR